MVKCVESLWVNREVHETVPTCVAKQKTMIVLVLLVLLVCPGADSAPGGPINLPYGIISLILTKKSLAVGV